MSYVFCNANVIPSVSRERIAWSYVFVVVGRKGKKKEER